VSRKSVRVLLVIALGCVLVLSLGCGKVAEKAAESATGVKVDKQGDKVTVTGKEGEIVAIEAGKLPEGMPEDFPIYEGEVKVGNKSESSDGTMFQVMIVTGDDAKTVADWYEEELKAKGWTIENRVDTSAGNQVMSAVSAKKGEDQATISAVEKSEDDKTGVSITLAVK
jgi:hypothetical protein